MVITKVPSVLVVISVAFIQVMNLEPAFHDGVPVPLGVEGSLMVRPLLRETLYSISTIFADLDILMVAVTVCVALLTSSEVEERLTEKETPCVLVPFAASAVIQKLRHSVRQRTSAINFVVILCIYVFPFIFDRVFTS